VGGVLLAGFTDERSAAVLPLVWLLARTRAERAGLIAGTGLWVAGRLGLGWAFGLQTGSTLLATKQILKWNFEKQLPWTVAGVFKAGWLWMAAGDKWAWLAAACAVAPAMMVLDLDRSVCYAFPALLLGVERLEGPGRRQLLAASLVANLVLTGPLATVLRLVYLMWPK